MEEIKRDRYENKERIKQEKEQLKIERENYKYDQNEVEQRVIEDKTKELAELISTFQNQMSSAVQKWEEQENQKLKDVDWSKMVEDQFR